MTQRFLKIEKIANYKYFRNKYFRRTRDLTHLDNCMSRISILMQKAPLNHISHLQVLHHFERISTTNASH